MGPDVVNALNAAVVAICRPVAASQKIGLRFECRSRTVPPPTGRDAFDKGKARDVQPRTACHKGTRMRKNKNRRIVKKGQHRVVSRRSRFEKADRVAFDLLPFGLVTPNIRQTRDAMPLQTPMPHRPGQVAVCLTRPVLAPKVHRSCSAPQGRATAHKQPQTAHDNPKGFPQGNDC
jgi:hypothetical protein